MAGMGTSTKVSVDTSAPSFSSAALIVTSQMLFSVLTATVRALEVAARPDAAVGPHEQLGPRVLLLRAAERALGDDQHGQVLRGRDEQRDRVGEAELELAAEHGGRDRRAAPGLLELDGQALALEEALLDAEVERGHVGDRDDADPHDDRVAPAPAVAAAAGRRVP